MTADGPRPSFSVRSLRSSQVETIEIHHLVPRSDKVTHKCPLRIVTCVDFRNGTELGVRTEDEIDGGACPLELARPLIASLEHVLGRRGRLPRRVHVEQVDKEITGQPLRPLGEDAAFGLPDTCVQERKPPTSTVISGAVKVNNCARSTSSSSADRLCPFPKMT